ncbi:hypothetical protein ACFUJY_12780 [Streptomyces sp. NPDC057249]|uniref:hypothetical protein n=1 Tax=Streptomyces sp. NPDC057249 TaxID=3346067 RepID=UPI00363477E4
MPTSDREPDPPRAAVPMSTLLAANAAATAVSTPPSPRNRARTANPEHAANAAHAAHPAHAAKSARTAKSGRAAQASPSGD